MALDKDAALDGAVAWLLAIRAKARLELPIANLLLDTQPDGISLSSLAAVLNDPSRLTAEEKDLIRAGNKIGSVKAIKARTKLGLKESLAIASAWLESERAAGGIAPAKSFAPVASLPPPLPTSLPDGTRILTPRMIECIGTDETPFDPSVLARGSDDDGEVPFRPSDETPFQGRRLELE